jgi:3-deoxy-D-arabino-heptulosonate 7-phosphate (DAHP) synthase class II
MALLVIKYGWSGGYADFWQVLTYAVEVTKKIPSKSRFAAYASRIERIPSLGQSISC